MSFNFTTFVVINNSSLLSIVRVNDKIVGVSQGSRVSYTSLKSFQFFHSGKYYDIDMKKVSTIPNNISSLYIIIHDTIDANGTCTASNTSELYISLTDSKTFYCLPCPADTVEGKLDDWFKSGSANKFTLTGKAVAVAINWFLIIILVLISVLISAVVTYFVTKKYIHR